MAMDLLTPADGLEPSAPSERSRAFKRFWRHPMGKIGVIGLLFIILFSFVGPLIYRVSPDATNLLYLLTPPSVKFPLGTDELGRNYLARVMVGGQLSLIVGFASAFATMLIGIAYGLISGYAGGYVDVVMMRIVDIMLTIPGLFILLLLDAMFSPSAFVLVFIIAFTSWFGVSRLVRSEVLSIKQRDYVEAARAFGASSWHIMTRELLPNVMGTVMVASTFQVAGAIITIATLSFLGLGLPPPTPNWGELLNASMSYMYQDAWWMIYPPGICLLITMLSFNFISEALQGVLDSRR
ncbi:MAG: ABC transporter permease [Firmicutes bacterium]|jgi:peptide/nickel transport system permease protein|nr:ABC transporter permease [Bacillota bacterium]